MAFSRCSLSIGFHRSSVWLSETLDAVRNDDKGCGPHEGTSRYSRGPGLLKTSGRREMGATLRGVAARELTRSGPFANTVPTGDSRRESTWVPNIDCSSIGRGFLNRDSRAECLGYMIGLVSQGSAYIDGSAGSRVGTSRISLYSRPNPTLNSLTPDEIRGRATPEALCVGNQTDRLRETTLRNFFS